MPAEKYTRSFLEEQLIPLIREQLREDGFNPNHLPTYEYLNARGFSTRGLNKAIQRHFEEDLSLHEFLSEQGLGHSNTGDWPSDHPPTIRILNRFIDSRSTDHGDEDPTVKTIESALRKFLRISQECRGNANLLSMAKYDSESERIENNEQLKVMLDSIQEDLSNATLQNYLSYLVQFYDFADPFTQIDYNPASKLDSFYTGDTSQNPQPLNTDQIRALWRAAVQLPESHELTEPLGALDLPESVKNLLRRHGIDEWKIQMMALLIICFTVGPRTGEVVAMDCREDWHLQNEPYIHFPERKNGPAEVPVLTHSEFLEAYRDYLHQLDNCDQSVLANEDWSGKPFPSSKSASGSRSKGTLNNWIQALCDYAGVRLDDGSFPTLQNLRQTWHTQFYDALTQHDLQVEIVADSAETENTAIVDNDYLDDKVFRRLLRDLADNRISQDVRDTVSDELSRRVQDTIDEELPEDTQNVISDELSRTVKQAIDNELPQRLEDSVGNYLKNHLPLSELPKTMRDVLDDNYIDHQTTLDELK